MEQYSIRNGGNATSLISVIMPCFNAEATIRWSIESVLRQLHQNFELVVVDDCSTDGSSEIAQSIAFQDPRVKVLKNRVNSGAGKSRNHGLANAKGEYVAFIDADDYFEVDFLSSLLEKIVRFDADIAQSRLRYIYENKSTEQGSPPGLISGEHCRYRIDIFDGLPYCTPHPCNKLYKRTLFEGLSYKGIHYEDTEIIPAIVARCRRLITIPEALYNYNKRYSSTTGTNATDLKKFDSYAASLPESVAPYVSQDFLGLLEKWRAPLPGAVYANISNFLKLLDASAETLSRRDVSLLARKIANLKGRMTTRMPHSVAEQFLDHLYSPKKAGSTAEKIRANWTMLLKSTHSYLLRFVEARLTRLFDKALPKDPNTWTFASWGHYELHTMDSPRAVYEAVKSDNSIKKIVLMNGKFRPSPVMREGSNVKFVPLVSFRGLYWLCRASRVFVAYSIHNLFGYRRLPASTSRSIIQLWHGIPIKNVGLKVVRAERWWPTEVKRYSFVPASSEIDRRVMVESFATCRENIVQLTGLPRHDLMFIADENLPADYRNDLNSVRNRLNGRRLVLFAPTWRSNGETPCMFSFDQFLQLDRLFGKFEAVLGCRLHRNMIKSPKGDMLISDNVIFLNDVPDVNVLFRECDAVVTDYSSLYLDFMKLDRPVLLYTPDLSNYSSNRGFNYTPDEFLPHRFEIRNFDDLLIKLSSILSRTFEIDEKFEEVCSRFHAFTLDGKSSERVLNVIDK